MHGGSIRLYLASEYQNVTVDEFKNLITCKILGINSIDEAKRYVLTEEDWKPSMNSQLLNIKLGEWNYGQSPHIVITVMDVSHGTIQCYLEVEQGGASNCRIFGDFFAKGNVQEVEEKLKGVRYGERRLSKKS